jgi:mRNA-degrading endonuclease RelE of RelBE toxin-antitoxin system
MARYDVALTSSAEKELKKLPGQWIARIVPRLENLASKTEARSTNDDYPASGL